MFQTIQTVDYEDELDLIVTFVTVIKHGDIQAKVKVYDNETGRFIRDIELDEPWAEVWPIDCRMKHMQNRSRSTSF